MIFILIAVIIVIILIFLEIWMYGLVHYPDVLRLFSRRLQNSISYLYIQGDRKIMQFQKGLGQHSPDLGYTFKPGTFVFTEIEFSNEYRVNSLGVRDDEAALDGPEIVLLGDSFGLGWGVDQAQTFIKLLEAKTGHKTLNTCVPSYGTVREMMMLRKVDPSGLKCLILQYCGDDYDENHHYYANGNRAQIMRAETFQQLTELHSRSKKYYPGKYLGLKIKKKSREWILKPPSSDNGPSLSDVDLFLHVLKQNADIVSHLPLIVFEMNGINQTNTFTTVLKKKATEPDQPLFIRNMIILDMSQFLEDRHFYVLDGHLNAAGHAVVAAVLYKTISREGIL